MIDDVTIKPNIIYLWISDQLIGCADMWKLAPKQDGLDGMLANKMLTFAIDGLSTPFTILIAYYLGKPLTYF